MWRDSRALSVILAGLALVTLGMAACGGGGGGPSSSSNIPPPTPAPPSPAPTPTPTPNVAGFWTSEARQWHIELRQSGSTLTGVLRGFKRVTYDNLDHPDLQIKGRITNAGHVEFGCTAFSMGFEGDVDSTRARITGTTFDCANDCRKYGDVWMK